MKLRAECRRILVKAQAIGAAVLLAALGVLFFREPLPAAADCSLTIVVDPGHGGADGGAVSPEGIEEAGLNLTVSLLLKEELEALGMEVILTREEDTALAPTKKADMAARKSIMNQPGVDAVVSVHMNKFTDCAVHGPMAFYMEGSSEGEKLATSVIAAVTAAIGADSRPANPGDYFVIRESRPVAVLVECGFLSNSHDAALLTDPAHQKKLARAIAEGVQDYFAPANGLD